MKRDCGIGELIPVKFEVVSCLGKSDVETETSHATLKEASEEFAKRKSASAGRPCSNVRLYAKDKAGYANCVQSWVLTKQGEETETNRLKEL